MSMVLTEEQSMLQESAAEFFTRNAAIAEFRQLRESPGQLPEGHLDALVELGWTGIMVPEEKGGLGFGLSGLSLIAIEAGRNLTVTPVVTSSAIAVNALLQCEASTTRDSLLEELACAKECFAEV